MFEGYYSVYKLNTYEEDGVSYVSGSSDLMPYKVFAYILLLLNVGMGGVLIYFNYLLIKNMGKQYFYRFYSLVEITYLSLAMVVLLICFI